MNKFLHTITAACVAAIVVLTAKTPVRASDDQRLAPAPHPAGKVPDALSPNAANEEAKDRTAAKVNVDSQGIILKGYDAVAYFKQRKPVSGNPAIVSTYQGAAYLFASSADKADFDKDPAKYAPKYGGFCAYGVANGVMADIEGPDAFAVYNGKLYLCGNQAALKGFKSDIDSNVKSADLNWVRLNGY